MAVRSISVVFCVLVSLLIVQSSKLNVPRVLLPIFADFSTKFTLEATEGGCYKWSTTRIDIINLTPIDVDSELDCSTKAVVSTITKERARNIAVVLAEDVDTNQILRCDVIVDVIESLDVVTTTKELFMEEAPEAFEVRAYDAQGNEFTTLEEAEFDWSIRCGGPNKDLTVLRFMAFQDSPYETPSTVETLEKRNKKGHIILLEGVKTGSAKVTVKLVYEEYKHIQPPEVQLCIIANLIIMPADVYIMVGDVVRFQIIHMNNGRMEEIKLPNVQYYIDVENTEIASSDTDFGAVTGRKTGKTKVILHDRNVNESDSGLKLATATINVVTPAYMTISILPHRNWAILLAEHHDIVAEVYSSNDHKLYLGDGVEIHTEVRELFHVEKVSMNGSWLTGWAKQEGVTSVLGLLKAVKHPSLGTFKVQPEITAQAELLIFPSIILNPNEIILPWNPQLQPKYEIEIKATGGDGKFLWSSSNHAIGVVTQSGYVRTHSAGYFEVSAAMMRNHHNRQSAVFHILPPTRLEIVEFVMEAEVGSIIYLHVAMYADKRIKGSSSNSQIPFTKCQELPFKIKSSDTNFIYNKSAIMPPVGISCATIGIVGNSVGVSKITIAYNSDGKILEDTVSVSTFKPLHLVHPRRCEILLVVGASSHLIFTGGPRPSAGRPSLHKRMVISQDTSIVAALDITDTQKISDMIVLNVLCLKLGTTEVTLSISNSPLLPNCKNQESFAKVTVICGKPRSIFLQPEIKIADINSCPMDLSADRVVAQSYKDIELDVAVTDEHGRRFLNISTLKFEWTINPENLGKLGTMDSVFSRNVTEGNIVFANRTYQVVSPKSKTGTIEITATVVGYQKNKLRVYGITPEWPEFVSEDEQDKELLPITTGIHLYLVDDTVVTPNVTSLYNHPGNKKILSVSQGSGFYEIGLSANNIADVKYLESTRELEIIPIDNGELQINLIDLCLVSQPAVIIVHVVSVSSISVEMSDKVEITRCISSIVRLHDASNQLLSIPDIDMIDLKINLERPIATVKPFHEDKNKLWPVGELHYVITGEELGITKLTFSIGGTSSNPIDLQVFPPLKIYPRNATLLLGGVLHFSNKGGPQPDNNIEYSANDNSIADISIAGLAQGLALGNTKIHARAVGINSNTGQKIIYSQDNVDLHVISICGIRISIPLTRFRVGATVPAWANGLPDELSPIILGAVDRPFRFEWVVADSEIITIHGSFKKHGVEYLPEDDISVRLTALAPGRTTLHLNAVIFGTAASDPDRKHVIYSANVDIEVFESLTLTSPKGISGTLVLMAPHSEIQLETNMDSSYKLYYSLSGSGEFSADGQSLQKSLSVPNPVITISQNGLLRSHDNFGRAMILVTATDEHGLKQTLSVIVEVKHVHYMLVNIIANWHIDSPSPIQVVPIGTEFELRATYHDNTGAKFTAASAELRLRSSRFDLIRVRPGNDNSSVFMSTRKSGYTLLKVWANDFHKTVDYIKLHVGQVISPEIENLTTGDIVCIWTPLIKSNNEAGKWSSSDPTLFTIDVKTGIGRVAGIRGGQVAITHSLHPSASINLQVIPTNQITMISPTGKVLTNAPEALVYRVPLVLLSEKSFQKTTNLMSGWHCKEELQGAIIYYPFKCHLGFTDHANGMDITSMLRVQTGFDFERGQYTCDILPGPEYSPNVSTVSGNVSIWAVLDGDEIKADPVELHFIPAIFVQPELILEDTYTATLTISGLDYVLDEVSVRPFDKNLLYVDSAETPEENIRTYEISLLDYHWKLDELGDPMNLIVTSQLTNQLIKVHVRTQAADGFGKQCMAAKHSPLISFMYYHRNTLAIIASMLIIFFITLYAYSRYIYPAINVNGNLNRSLLVSSNQMTSFTSGVNSSNQQDASMRSNTCPTMAYMQRSGNRNATFNRDPVYGDPNSFYSTSPEIRRNRRFI